jgi:hypothetical protein
MSETTLWIFIKIFMGNIGPSLLGVSEIGLHLYRSIKLAKYVAWKKKQETLEFLLCHSLGG